MKYLSQIQRGIDFVEQNLDSTLPLDEVGRMGGMSQWHFQRCFKALTGETLKTYIRSRRLSKSLSKLLEKGELGILDVAIEAGFESQEAFTRAFKKTFKMTPGQFRAIGDQHLFMKRVQIDSEYLQHIHKNVSLDPELVEQKKRYFVGTKTKYFGAESEKNNFSEKLPTLWGQFGPRVHEVEMAIPGICYGVIQKPEGTLGELTYWACTEVTSISKVPEGMDGFVVPAARYARFSHAGDPARLDQTVDYIYSTWMSRSPFDFCESVDIEVYGPQYLPGSEDSLMFYDLPIRGEGQ